MPKTDDPIPLTVDDLRDIAVECQLILPDGEVTPELIQYTHAIVGMTDHDIKDGVLTVKQAKTRTKVRIEVIGELATVIARIRERRNKFKVVTTSFVVNGYGRPVLARTVSEWLKDARRLAGVPDGEFQFRDLRAKVLAPV